MDPLTGLSIFSTMMKVGGSLSSASAAKANAKALKESKEFEEAQLRQQAGLSIALAQRAAEEERRKARLVQSRTLAVAAASGGGVSDPTIVNMLARVAGEGTYRAANALWGGEERARILRMQAAAADYEGKVGLMSGEAKANALQIQGMGDLISGGLSLFGKYNPGVGSGLDAGGASGTAMVSDGFGGFVGAL